VVTYAIEYSKKAVQDIHKLKAAKLERQSEAAGGYSGAKSLSVPAAV